MLPDSDYCPPFGLKHPCVARVAFDVALEFWSPVRRVDSRGGSVSWAAVPEAPVDENGDAPTGEHDVRTHPASRQIDAKIAPVPEPFRMQ